MRSGMIAFGAMVVAVGGVAMCPSNVRAELAERTNVPEHYVLEAERQIEVFVAWLRADGDKPSDVDEMTERALG
ncbi:hypothetical protein [Maricaulis sp.]|uniref:hypothetical protein n=1 Tax=Maricaulis sp. TaxID=1486257 RepID=UPI001B24F9CB|nr:hypothetical protein [Maricaulis sp.]MBO6798064.1 hypothetical protein [Maricaulis sp.]